LLQTGFWGDARSGSISSSSSSKNFYSELKSTLSENNSLVNEVNITEQAGM
jgi:hypothetical protein